MKNEITCHELHSVLNSNPAVALIDVRTPAEFDGAHIAEARSIPLNELGSESLRQAGLNPEDPLYLICQSGSRARSAAEKCSQLGFRHPRVVDGGVQAWESAGFALQKGAVRIWSLDRQLRIVLGSLVLTGVLLAYFVHPHWIWLSGFVGAGLIFAGITDICMMHSLISRMPWNQRSTGSCCKGGNS